MRCHYDVLGIEQDADDASVRGAYRRCALQWHPDKNQHRLAEAEEHFKEIQAAYQVLNDTRERSWYDSHRDAILRSADRPQGGDWTPGQPPPDEVNLYPYFSSSCFSGYADGPKGFYTVYAELFARLARQEAEAASKGGPAEVRGAAAQVAFGDAGTEWPQVARFYAQWLSFSTCKDFAWGDQYHPASAPHRKARRVMEEENRKRRRGLRREFSETVRELAAFVRRRDKRVAAHQAAEAQRKLEREAQELARREQEKAERAARAREYREAEWLQTDAGDASEASECDAVEQLPDELFCLACDKLFKSAGAFSNHERSKKHLERVAALREVMEQEEAEIQLDQGLTQPHPPSAAAQDARGTCSAAAASAEDVHADSSEASEEGGADVASDEVSFASRATSVENELAEALKCVRVNGGHNGGEAKASSSSEDSELDEDEMLRRLISAQAPPRRPPRQGPGTQQLPREQPEPARNGLQRAAGQLAGTDTAAADILAAELSPQPARQRDPCVCSADVEDEPSVGPAAARAAEEDDAESAMACGPFPGSNWEQPSKKGKRGQRRAAHGTRPAVQEAAETAKLKARAGQDTVCHVCGMKCRTRNQLFKHITASGHAELKH